jgi:hypothetical protein
MIAAGIIAFQFDPQAHLTTCRRDVQTRDPGAFRLQRDAAHDAVPVGLGVVGLGMRDIGQGRAGVGQQGIAHRLEPVVVDLQHQMVRACRYRPQEKAVGRRQAFVAPDLVAIQPDRHLAMRAFEHQPMEHAVRLCRDLDLASIPGLANIRVTARQVRHSAARGQRRLLRLINRAGQRDRVDKRRFEPALCYALSLGVHREGPCSRKVGFMQHGGLLDSFAGDQDTPGGNRDLLAGSECFA